MKIYICEDDLSQRQHITKIINNYILIENLDMKIQLSTSDPLQILQAIDQEQSVYFLDIGLHSELNGLELASAIRKADTHGYIIFITTHDEMAFETFKYQVAALDFILKDQGNLKDNIVRVFQTIQQQLMIDADDNDTIAIKLNDRILYINLKTLIYIETLSNHKLVLHAQNKESLITGDLKAIEQRLPNNFFRAHKSFLVNLDYVDHVDKKQNLIFFRNGASCLVSRRKIKLLTEHKLKLN